MSDSILLWPFKAIWKLTASLLQLAGRLVVGILGLLAIILGVLACLTIVGCVIGIPLVIVGVLLILRSLF